MDVKYRGDLRPSMPQRLGLRFVGKFTIIVSIFVRLVLVTPSNPNLVQLIITLRLLSVETHDRIHLNLGIAN